MDRALSTQNEIQTMGAAALANMAKKHPTLFRQSMVQSTYRRSRFEAILDPLGNGEKTNLGDPLLRPLILLTTMLPNDALRNVRLVSRTANQAVFFLLPRLFEEIYVTNSGSSNQLKKHVDALQQVGPYCQELLISLSSGTDLEIEEPNLMLPEPLTEFMATSRDTKSYNISAGKKTRSPDLELEKTYSEPVHKATTSQRIEHKISSLSLDRDEGTASHIHPALRETPEIGASSRSWEALEKPSLWLYLFRLIPNLSILNIAITNRDTSWHALTSVEWTLVKIRNALEKSYIEQSHYTHSRLHSVRLAPSTAMSILPMRWASLTALSTSSYSEWWTSLLWSSLAVLEIQIHNPYSDLSSSESRMFGKILHDYLFSFRDTLQILRFAWLGGIGPNPLLLDLEAQLRPERPGRRSRKGFSAPGIVWESLREVWLGAILVGPFAAAIMASRAEKLGGSMVLHGKHWAHLESGQAFDFEESDGWQNILDESDEVPVSEAEALDEIEQFRQAVQRKVRGDVDAEVHGAVEGKGSRSEVED